MSVENVGPGAPPEAAPAPWRPETPPRPAGVPEAAPWSHETGEWELAPRDADGRREGLARAWHPDGTLASETTFRGGEREGPYRRFHQDGSLAREGLYHEGRPHGLMRAHGTDAPTTEPMQSCCVPEGAWRLEHDYDDGHLAEVRWYDRAGVHILPSGAPHPARPEAVPRDARYEEGRDQWVLSRYADGGVADGVWLRWARDGGLRERDEYRLGKAHGLWRRFDVEGALGEESEWRDGVREGAHRRVVDGANIYRDGRVHEERGLFANGRAVGAWSLHDAGGAILAAFDLGAPLEDDALLASPALAEPETDAPTRRWDDVAAALAGEGKPAEAILAAARAAAATRDGAALERWLTRLALPRTAESALAFAAELVARTDGPLAALASGLPAGADAANLLRAFASALAGRERVALDLVDAALLLAPGRLAAHVTRALVNLHLGRPEDALADADALGDDLDEQRAFIRDYARVIFTDFPFAPARTAIATQFPDVPEAPEQPLESVVLQIQKYATRLGRLRAAVAARLPAGASPAWLPPDLSALLPEGPAPLERWDFEEIVEDELPAEPAADDDSDTGSGAAAPASAALAAPTAPTAPTAVTVDEQLVVAADASLPTLMRHARREWIGLSWLCWSAGLDGVALPRALAPPADFGLAAGMSIERLWRCRDKLITGGLRALTKGVPGFVWEGLEIDLMPAVLAEIAADEHLEMRAVFYWLCDAGVQSPWQDNLRAPD
jgi:antitoxin component YwqK of YwqJK toxin-antitoxin module